jgi:site-specific DNA recombinase
MSKSNAVILCRISDQKQDDGYSLDAQERFGVECCQQRGFNLLKVFRFVETGSKSGKRQKFDAMMEYLREQIEHQRENDPVHLVVEKPDRLTRNFTNREEIQFFVMMGRLVIHYYKDRRIMDRNCSPADIFTDDMMTSVSKYIALNIAREVKKGMNEKANNGWYPAHPPIGYKYVRDGVVGKHGRKEARITIDEDLKKVVYRIFELRAVEKRSYEAIGNTVREEFKDLLGQKKYKFNKSSIEKILLNPFYGGTFEWQSKTYQGKHELFLPPLAQIKNKGVTEKWCAGGDLNPYAEAHAPQTCVSTSSTTRAIDRLSR